MTLVVLRRLQSLWLAAWPLWTFLIFEAVVAVRLLPGGYVRAAVVTPIVLMAPGSLTLGAVFARSRRPQGPEFVCFAVLLSVIWAGFASLALYACGVLITASSTYLSLLIVATVLTIVAEGRFLLERQGSGRRIARKLDPHDPDVSSDEGSDSDTSIPVRGTINYPFVAAVAGVCLLAGGLYAYTHLPRPASTGFTFMAWTGSRISGDIPVGSGGRNLDFQIVHHQSETTAFRLSATWLTSPARVLVKPQNISIGPDGTFHGVLFIPSPPDGCTYRIVVTLTAIRQIDPLTKKLQNWSINADVHNPAKPQNGCS